MYFMIVFNKIISSKITVKILITWWYLHYWTNTRKGYKTILPKIYNYFQKPRRWQNRNRTDLTNSWLLLVYWWRFSLILSYASNLDLHIYLLCFEITVNEICEEESLRRKQGNQGIWNLESHSPKRGWPQISYPESAGFLVSGRSPADQKARGLWVRDCLTAGFSTMNFKRVSSKCFRCPYTI